MKIFFIGIGGISMSALAQFLDDSGDEVSGSDVVENEMVKKLRQKGIKITVPQKVDNIDKTIDEVVYTSAITPGSPGDAELKQAIKMGIKTSKRAAKIGELTKKYKTIAISGTHGKSTTTAMVTQVLLEADFDPSALLGSNFDFINSNYRVGKSKYMIIESDEFDRSFHSFYVDYGAILNLEADHLDYFKGGLSEIKEAFAIYFEKNFKKNGTLIYNVEDKNLAEIISKNKRTDLKLMTFGRGESDYSLEKIKLSLGVPGEHNKLDALAAMALAEAVGVSREQALKSLKKFKGATRRFDFKGEKNGIKVFDDYAHHPTEIKATLEAAREKFPKQKIIVVFQPHQYSRTAFFADEFASALSQADKVIVPPIYAVAGREEEKKIDNKKLVKMVNDRNKIAKSVDSFEQAAEMIESMASSGDIVLVMGAGPVNEVADIYLK